MGDLRGHVVKNIDGFHGVHGVHGGFSIGERNQEGMVLLEFCDAQHMHRQHMVKKG